MSVIFCPFLIISQLGSSVGWQSSYYSWGRWGRPLMALKTCVAYDTSPSRTLNTYEYSANNLICPKPFITKDDDLWSSNLPFFAKAQFSVFISVFVSDFLLNAWNVFYHSIMRHFTWNSVVWLKLQKMSEIWIIWISRTFFVFCLPVKKCGKLQMDK